MALLQYSAPSGVPIYGGRAAPSDAPAATVAYVGDSLTALSYGPIHPYAWSTTGVLKPVANCGVASDTIQNVLARIDNSYTASQPGLAGLTDLGWVFCRIGTNNFRDGASLGTSQQNAYIALFDKLLSYAKRVIVFAVPPVYDVGDARGNGIPGANAWLASYCAGRAGMYFVDDCVDVRNGGNWIDSSYALDGIHFNDRCSYALGKTADPLVAAILAPYGYPSPLSTDAADKYPAQPQWVNNHLMGGAGPVPTNWTVSSGGAGNVATTSIVPADGGDANQTPWLRVAPTSVGASGTWLNTRCTLSYAPLTTAYPDALDIVAEIRFNDFDAQRFFRSQFYIYGASNERLSPDMFLRLRAPERVTRRVVMRQAIRRSSTRVAHASALMEWRWQAAAAYTGDMGSFDIRCVTVRG